MPRISVVEQYDNKDLIQQIYRLKELVETGTASNIAVTDNHDGTITVDVTMRDGSIQTFTLANDNIATITAVQNGGDVTVTVTFESGSTQSFTFNVASSKVDVLTTPGNYVYSHNGATQGEISVANFVDVPNVQAITGVKTVPLETTGVFSDQIASSNKVKDELDNYAPMVRTTGNQLIMGQKIIESLAVGADFDNKCSVTLFDNDTSKYCRMYTYNNSTGAQYKSFMVMITPKRLNVNRTGLLYFGDNRNTAPTIGWLLKGSDITNTDFVITKEADGTINVWCKTYGGSSDGYHGIRILEHTTSNLSAGYLEAVVNEEGYVISSTGYTDSQGVVHTFTSYVTPS